MRTGKPLLSFPFRGACRESAAWDESAVSRTNGYSGSFLHNLAAIIGAGHTVSTEMFEAPLVYKSCV